MKEEDLSQKLYEILSDEFSGDIKESPKILEIPEKEKNQRSYICNFQLTSLSNRLATQFFFEKSFGAGYLPIEYRMASYADRPIPSTIIATAYPKGGVSGKIGRKKYIFLPVYPNNLREFDSDRFYEEKIGWYTLIETLNNDNDIASWFENMPLKTFAGNRKLSMYLGSSRDYFASFGQLVPSPYGKKYITTIGFRSLPKWDKKRFALGSGLGRGVTGVDVSYIKDLAKIIGQINDHILSLNFNDQPSEIATPANVELFRLSGEVLD